MKETIEDENGIKQARSVNDQEMFIVVENFVFFLRHQFFH
jgi:hypothetical protein